MSAEWAVAVVVVFVGGGKRKAMRTENTSQIGRAGTSLLKTDTSRNSEPFKQQTTGHGVTRLVQNNLTLSNLQTHIVRFVITVKRP